MTMNPHTSASQLRREGRIAQAKGSQGGQAARKHTLTPTVVLSAAFILAVSFIAKVFYE